MPFQWSSVACAHKSNYEVLSGEQDLESWTRGTVGDTSVASASAPSLKTSGDLSGWAAATSPPSALTVVYLKAVYWIHYCILCCIVTNSPPNTQTKYLYTSKNLNFKHTHARTPAHTHNYISLHIRDSELQHLIMKSPVAHLLSLK